MPLTDTACRNAKATNNPQKLSDGGGLFLLVQPNGSKLWRLAYRYAGKQKLISFGAYPAVPLSDARAGRDQAKRLLAQGIDPSAQRKADQRDLVAKGTNTFRAIAEELLHKHEREGRTAATIHKQRWMLEFAFPIIGNLPITSITPPQLLEALRTVEIRGRYETARRLRSTAGMVFRYAIATGRAERDISIDLRGALITPKVKHRATMVEPKQIGALLRAIDSFDGQPTTLAALRLAPLLFVRPGELRASEWTEFDLEVREWCIPAEKMKMRRPHRVPLSKQAISIIRDLHKITGTSKYLFPSVRSWHRPISDNTLNAALRRLGYAKEEITAHGFRAMAATRLNEMGKWSRDAIERQLAHQEENAVRRAYVHSAEFWQERVAMMQAWADYLDSLREKGKVVKMARR